MERRMQITATRPASPVLESGDRLDREEFERRYEARADDLKCELIGGVVYVASPVRTPHAHYDNLLAWLLGAYAAETPGVDALDDPTLRLGPEDEPQPDVALRLVEGGRSHLDADEYLVGPPELIVEVAHSSAAYDLHDKKDCYARHGCREYLVVLIHEREARWFTLSRARGLVGYRSLPAKHGRVRSRQFPGLWLDVPALFAGDRARLLATLREGLASVEHARFVRRLSGE